MIDKYYKPVEVDFLATELLFKVKNLGIPSSLYYVDFGLVYEDFSRFSLDEYPFSEGIKVAESQELEAYRLATYTTDWREVTTRIHSSRNLLDGSSIESDELLFSKESLPLDFNVTEFKYGVMFLGAKDLISQRIECVGMVNLTDSIFIDHNISIILPDSYSSRSTKFITQSHTGIDLIL